jgi:hypothetical protein
MMPEKSNRQIAKDVNASPTTVGKKRAAMEAAGDVSKLDTRTDSKGRQQPASKLKHKDPEAKEAARVARSLRRQQAEEEAREKRRQIEEEARENRQREYEATIRDRAAALIDQHGLETARAFSKSLLAFPAYELPDLLKRLVGVDTEQRDDGEAA